MEILLAEGTKYKEGDILNMPIADKVEYRDTFLKCPFCLARIEKWEDMSTPFGSMVNGGSCTCCGAVFMHDRSGKNQGEAFADALAMAHGWDYDKAMAHTEPYEEAIVRYAPTSGKYLLGEGGRTDRSPRFIFVRLIEQGEDGEK